MKLIQKKINWGAVSAITAIIALICTVVITTLQNSRNEAAWLKEIKLSHERLSKQHIADSINYEIKVEMEKTKINEQRIVDSIQLVLAQKQIIEQKEMGLKQIELARLSISFQEDQKRRSILESLLLEIDKKIQSLSNILSNLENVTYYGDSGGREVGDQPIIRSKLTELEEMTQYNYLNQFRIEVDYVFNQDSLLLELLNTCYRDIFNIKDMAKSIELGGFRTQRQGYPELRDQLLKLQPIYSAMKKKVAPQIRLMLYRKRD